MNKILQLTTKRSSFFGIILIRPCGRATPNNPLELPPCVKKKMILAPDVLANWMENWNCPIAALNAALADSPRPHRATSVAVRCPVITGVALLCAIPAITTKG
jgi:hypothetical protein